MLGQNHLISSLMAKHTLLMTPPGKDAMQFQSSLFTTWEALVIPAAGMCLYLQKSILAQVS